MPFATLAILSFSIIFLIHFTKRVITLRAARAACRVEPAIRSLRNHQSW